MAEEKSSKIKSKKIPGVGIIRFTREVIVELRKVVWPTRRQVAIYTVVVIAASIAMAFFIAGVDWIFNNVDMALWGK